jgi:hypothetical protein
MSNQGMYRVVTRITFVQVSTVDLPDRNRTLIYNFVNQYEASSSWQELSNTARITLPKNVYTRDANGKLVNLAGTTVNIGGFSNNAPLFLRGDKVTIEAGYRYFDVQNNEKLTTAILFAGYVSKVGSKMPFIIECIDNMYVLQNLDCENKTYPASFTVEDILTDMLQGTDFTVNVTTDTSVGEFKVENETVAQILARLRNDFHFYATFRGNELRVGSLVYLEQDAIDSGLKTFRFQHNIISDALDYNRTEDMELSAICYSINKIELGTTTKTGKKRTKHHRLEALVTIRRGKTYSIVKPDKGDVNYAKNVTGERRTLYFWNVLTTAKLVELGEAELKKYYYNGLKGKFTTFGMPYVQQGDNVNIIDNKLPERNGRYKVRSVRYTGAVQGLQQEIELDYLITRIDDKGNAIS